MMRSRSGGIGCSVRSDGGSGASLHVFERHGQTGFESGNTRVPVSST